MSINIYVGNLSFSVDSSELQSLFVPFGTVKSANVIMDRETGRSKGFGFVEMTSEEAGQRAIEGMNGRVLDERELVVKAANGRPTAPEAES